MKGTVWRRGAGGAALTLLLAVGLGCMNVTLIRTVEDLWFTEFYHVTWIPWLVMGLAVIGCLALLGALILLDVFPGELRAGAGPGPDPVHRHELAPCVDRV